MRYCVSTFSYRTNAPTSPNPAPEIAVASLEIAAAESAGDIGIDTGGSGDRVVEFVGIRDVDLSELSASLEAVPGVANVGFEHSNPDVEPRAELEARRSRPDAAARGQAANADVLEATGSRGPADVRADPLLTALPDPFFRAELSGVEGEVR